MARPAVTPFRPRPAKAVLRADRLRVMHGQAQLAVLHAVNAEAARWIIDMIDHLIPAAPQHDGPSLPATHLVPPDAPRTHTTYQHTSLALALGEDPATFVPHRVWRPKHR